MESTKEPNLPKNPRKGSSILSNLFFCYTYPIFLKGRINRLKPHDLYQALEEDRSSLLAVEMVKTWQDEVATKKAEGVEPKLVCSVYKVFRKNIIRLGFYLFFLEFFLKVTQPVFVGLIVSYYANPSTESRAVYMYAVALVISSALNVVFSHAFMLNQIHCGMKLRIALIGMIYRKSLQLSNSSIAEATVGKIVNLITNDVGKMDLAMIGLHQLWLGPLETIVIVFLIYRQIGMAAFAGVLILVLFIPIQGMLGKKVAVLRTRTAHQTDERVRLINEITQAIQVIKMYAWEKSFGWFVDSARKREIETIRLSSYIKGAMLSFMIFVTRFSIFASLILYALLGQQITAEKAFVVTAYYGVLRQTMTVMFPRGIAQLAETLVSLKRIETFMLSSETKVKQPTADNDTLHGETQSCISVTHADSEEERIIDMSVFPNYDKKRLEPIDHEESKIFLKVNAIHTKWNSNSPNWALDGISFEANAGQLIAIIGPVGSGKSSLIQTILGEMDVVSGTIEFNGVLSYAAQEPWIFGGTVRQNILFGCPFEKRRYKLTIKQCALERDFQQFQHGDRTLVGDRGQSLSGGQKARISLARTIYCKGSIYLLDGPLSSVDSHVARHLFNQCIRKYLRRHIVLLVTNQPEFLEEADKIIIMKKGRIDAMGSYVELKSLGLDFANLLSENVEEIEKEVDLVDLVATAALLREAYSRQGSIVSITSMEEPEPSPDARLLVEESQMYGAVGLSTYKRYVQAGGGVFTFVAVILFCIVTQCFASGCDYFLAYWVDREVLSEFSKNSFQTNGSSINTTMSSEREASGKNWIDITFFTGLIVGLIVVALSRSIVIFNVAMKASRTLHEAMYKGISHASMYFFNTNPVGRILNRFSKDMGQVDEVLPSILIDMIQVFFTLVGILIVISFVNGWLLFPAFVIVVIFFLLRDFYLRTSRSVTRMEGVARSPVYAHFSASLNGLPTIRAFNAQTVLIHEFDSLQDAHSSVFYTMISCARAFGFWLDGICVLFITTVTLSFFVFGSNDPGNVGLAITQAIGMTGMVQWGMRQSAEMENIMTAVERVTEYENLEYEQFLEESRARTPPKGWPARGHIQFDNLSLKYTPDSEATPAVKNISLEILPGEKVGIVGRTGAGKSSLINALFRLSFSEGNIWIDGWNIKDVRLYDLRSNLSIIPQEPMLFSGSIRYNLDPSEEHTDAKLWEVLEEVQLKHIIVELKEGLYTKVTESGTNYSLGQRQLICLARTILRRNKILIMDEATSNVDPLTDALIHATIRKKFNECTVITIAHRLSSVMQSDRVIVMDSGRIIEAGIPYLLLTESSTVFRKMAHETGKLTFNNLLKMAKEAYESKREL